MAAIKTGPVLAALWIAGCSAALSQTGQKIDDVPLPKDVASVSEPAAYKGLWLGRWGGGLKHAFIVESADRAVYAVGNAPAFGVRSQWLRTDLTLTETTATAKGRGFQAVYRRSPNGHLWATYQAGEALASALMIRHDLQAVLSGKQAPIWSNRETVMLATRLRTGDKPVRLETVIVKPDGPGPFPLAVINHGSTGRGQTPAFFKQTWADDVLADYLTARGYLVAFPQRRGRGQSDGLYDEGFAPDRTLGYTCDRARTLAGADRALEDIDAALSALRERPDVAAGPVLMMGQSRGGILSVAYAGAHPTQVKGVVNFVGGWLGELCATAANVNQTLMKRGTAFGRPMAWLYGDGDPFYSLGHMRTNHAAFVAAGGQAPFTEIDVPGRRTGHGVLQVPRLWLPVLDAYLDALD